jgi:bifunctional DNase/RNase
MRTFLLTALFSASTLTIHAHALPADGQNGRTQLELAGVLEVGDGAATLVILREKGSRTILPMLLQGEAGRALAADLQSLRAPALLGVTLRALGARVQEIELQGTDDEVRTGRARVSQGEKVVDVAGHPPELVSLAVETGAPIFIDRHLLQAAGLTPEEIDRARRRLEARHDQTWL